jgi:hypothetical protein
VPQSFLGERGPGPQSTAHRVQGSQAYQVTKVWSSFVAFVQAVCMFLYGIPAGFLKTFKNLTTLVLEL